MTSVDPFGGITLLGSRDVCDLMKVSKNYLIRLVEKGKLSAQKTSSGYIFEQESVLEFQKNRITKSKYDPRVQL